MPGAQAREVIVAAGDTLEAIARTNGVSLEALLQRNGIQDPSRLQIGQKLLLPKPVAGSSRTQPTSRGSEAIAPPPPPGRPHNILWPHDALLGGGGAGGGGAVVVASVVVWLDLAVLVGTGRVAIVVIVLLGMSDYCACVFCLSDNFDFPDGRRM